MKRIFLFTILTLLLAGTAFAQYNSEYIRGYHQYKDKLNLASHVQITGTWSCSDSSKTCTEDSTSGAATTELSAGDVIILEDGSGNWRSYWVESVTDDDTFLREDELATGVTDDLDAITSSACYIINTGVTDGGLYQLYDGAGNALPLHLADYLLASTSADEVAVEIAYTTNKTSGTNNDTGLLISKTDTASPGSSYLIDAQVDTTSIFAVAASGTLYGGGPNSNGDANLYLSVSNRDSDYGAVLFNAQRDLSTAERTYMMGYKTQWRLYVNEDPMIFCYDSSIYGVDLCTSDAVNSRWALVDAVYSDSNAAYAFLGDLNTGLDDVDSSDSGQFEVLSQGNQIVLFKPTGVDITGDLDVSGTITAGTISGALTTDTLLNSGGDEESMDLAYTVNKSAGDATGLKITATETATGSGAHNFIHVTAGATGTTDAFLVKSGVQLNYPNSNGDSQIQMRTAATGDIGAFWNYNVATGHFSGFAAYGEQMYFQLDNTELFRCYTDSTPVRCMNSSGSSGWALTDALYGDSDAAYGFKGDEDTGFDAVNTSGNFEALSNGSQIVLFDPNGIDVTGDITATEDISADHFIPGTCTIAADDATPSAGTCSVLTTQANSGATAITDIDNPVVGSTIILIGGSDTNSSTIADSGNFNLTAAWTASLDDVLALYVQADNDYIELYRSDN